MNLWRAIGDLLRGRRLRNKPGGLAYVKGIDQLEGRIVTTVKVEQGDFWVIEPQLPHMTRHFIFVFEAQVWAIRDHCLVPLKDPPHDARDESLAYLPPVPKHEPAYPTVTVGPGQGSIRKTAPTQRAGQG